MDGLPQNRQELDQFIGYTVKQLRLKRGWSTRKLADFSGVSHKTICDMERGINVSSKTLLAVVAALDHKVVIVPAPRRPD